MKHSARNGWDWKRLDQVADVRTGLAKNEGKGIQRPISVPYLRVANVQDGYLDLSEIKTITIEASDVDRYRLKAGDVLMNEGGDFDKLGRGAVWPGSIDPCVHQNHVFSVRPRPGAVLSAFLSAYCGSEAGKRYFLSCSKQTTNLASINSTQLREMPIPVPPLDEQRRIVAVLETWDRAIADTERLIAAKRRRKRGLLQTLFRNQPRRPFLEAAEFWFSGVDKKSKADETAVRLCNYMDVFHNARITADLDFMQATATRSEIAANTLRAGDVVFTKDSETMEEIAEPALVAEDIDNLVCGYHLAIARAREGVAHGPFIAQAMRHSEMRWQFSRLANGVVRFGLTLDAIEQAEIFLPPLPVQQRIAAVLDAEDDALDGLAKQLGRLHEQKRGLMQKLLTGNWRLDSRFDPDAALTLAAGGAR